MAVGWLLEIVGLTAVGAVAAAHNNPSVVAVAIDVADITAAEYFVDYVVVCRCRQRDAVDTVAVGDGAPEMWPLPKAFDKRVYNDD